MRKGQPTGIELNCYEFPDSTKAYFQEDDKKHHIVVRPGETLELDIRVGRYSIRRLKISYGLQH